MLNNIQGEAFNGSLRYSKMRIIGIRNQYTENQLNLLVVKYLTAIPQRCKFTKRLTLQVW